MRTLNVDGSVADPVEDAYDHSCVLLALAEAHRVGNPDALAAGATRPSRFLDAHLEDVRLTGYPGDAGRPGARGAPTRICICWKRSSPGTR